MKSIGYAPDCGTCNYLFLTLSKIVQFGEAVEVLKGMRRAECVPDCDSYGGLIAELSEARKVDVVAEVVREMIATMAAGEKGGKVSRRPQGSGAADGVEEQAEPPIIITCDRANALRSQGQVGGGTVVTMAASFCNAAYECLSLEEEEASRPGDERSQSSGKSNFPMRIQSIDWIPSDAVKPPVFKSQLKRLFDRSYTNVLRISSSALTEFTIHGLWPDYNDGTWPACCPGKRFNIKKISTLLSTMKKYWPSYNCESSSNCHNGTGLFWEHEEVLREAGYVASNCEKYPLGGIVSAMEKAYHATPALACSGDAVEELRLCFSKDFKFRDCGVEIPPESSCPEYVSLPKFISSGLGIKEAKALKLET
ncbi:hypothetical protein SASPL_122924 [Salvia splendens]|uniref:Uncharacterized protein n=1 Tax=Salvia splendens TaxID=180675 RepID=A0A8X8ZSI0_SALSN|nr:hypothetical protein SASPL_122924 [Salvia splendens]